MSKFLAISGISQPKGSNECGIAASKMIGDHFGLRQPYDAMKADLPYRPESGLYIYEIGSYFLKRGFKAEVVTMNTRFLNMRHQNASTAQLRKHVEELKPQTGTDPHFKNMGPGLQTITDFIDAGGKLTARIPTPHMIEQEIYRNRPVLAAVTTAFLYPGVAIKHNEHFAVITGFDRRDFTFNDSASYLHGKPQRAKKSDLMYAIYANAYPSVEGASILKLKL